MYFVINISNRNLWIKFANKKINVVNSLQITNLC